MIASNFRVVSDKIRLKFRCNVTNWKLTKKNFE